MSDVPHGYVEVFTHANLLEGTSVCFCLGGEWIFGKHVKSPGDHQKWAGWDAPNLIWAQWEDDPPNHHAYIDAGNDNGDKIYALINVEYDLDQKLDEEEDLL